MFRIYSTFHNKFVNQYLTDMLEQLTEDITAESKAELLATIRTSDYPDLVIVDELELAKKLRLMIDRPIIMIVENINLEERLSSWDSGITYFGIHEFPKSLVIQKITSIASLQKSIDLKSTEARKAGIDMQLQLKNFQKYYQPRILVVDDVKDVFDSVKKIVSQLNEFSNVIVDHALNLSTAREFLSKTEPTMIVLDNNLENDEQGVELFDEINDKFRVVFLTGEASLTDAVNEIKSGALDYLIKPMDLAFGRNFFGTYLPLLKITSFLNYVLR